MDKKDVMRGLNLIILMMAWPVQALTLNGYTDHSAVVNLNARNSGIVQIINVKQGQRVKKGDVLIKLDGIAQQANLRRSQAIEKSLLPMVETAQLELDRAFELYDRDSLSQVELKNAENKLAQAEGEYLAAQADTEMAAYQLANAVIRSPINGRVMNIHVSIAHYVDPSVQDSPMITLIDSQQMKAVALVNSEQWSSSLLNKNATVEYRNKKFSGKVGYIGYNRIKQPGGTSAYEIHITFKSDSLIPADMPVSIRISD